MKKLLTVVTILALLTAVVCLPLQSAAEGTVYPLLESSIAWTSNAHGGAAVEITEKDGTFVFSGSVSGTWPSVSGDYLEPKKVDVAHYSLHYDFTLDAGNTNITFHFDSYRFPLSNTSIGDVNYEAGSGDLLPGDYEGTVRLSDFVASNANLYGTPFDQSVVIEGMLSFTGITVYSVNGGVITVRALELVPDEGYEPDPEPVSDEPTPVTDDPNSEPEPVSDEPAPVSDEPAPVSDEPAPVSDEPAPVSDEPAPVSDEPASVAEESAPEQTPEQKPATILGMQVWAFVLLICGIVAVIALVLFLILGRKKKA